MIRFGQSAFGAPFVSCNGAGYLLTAAASVDGISVGAQLRCCWRLPAQHFSRGEFRRWAEGQKRRYERIAGEPVVMSPERIAQARTKSRVWAALDRAISQANLPCEAPPDGIIVEIGTWRFHMAAAVCARSAAELRTGRAISLYGHDRDD